MNDVFIFCLMFGMSVVVYGIFLLQVDQYHKRKEMRDASLNGDSLRDD